MTFAIHDAALSAVVKIASCNTACASFVIMFKAACRMQDAGGRIVLRKQKFSKAGTSGKGSSLPNLIWLTVPPHLIHKSHDTTLVLLRLSREVTSSQSIKQMVQVWFHASIELSYSADTGHDSFSLTALKAIALQSSAAQQNLYRFEADST